MPSEQPKIDIGQAAFPRDYVPGMYLLDYFAAQALVGLLANNNLQHTAVTDAYVIAEMMMHERNKYYGS